MDQSHLYKPRKEGEKNMNLNFFGMCKMAMNDGNMYDLNVDSKK
jgi:hypothetical protein